MAKPKKSPRPRAVTPKGFRDYFGAEVGQRSAMLARIADVYHRYGFDALESSAVETVEALGKFLPDVDRPNEGVFAWQEDDGDWLALRYDLTAPLARVYAQHRNDLPTPYRRYAMGPVWRNEKPGPGRFRQFYQCDADTVGSASMAADAEICALLADTLEAVGIERGDYIIRVNNRKVLNGVLETMGLADAEQRAAVLRTIDKFDKVGEAGVCELLGNGRRDASGAYIDGVGLSAEQSTPVVNFVLAKKIVIDRIERELDGYADSSSSEYRRLLRVRSVERGTDRQRGLRHSQESGELLLSRLLGFLNELVSGSETGREGVQELREISGLLMSQGYGPDRIQIDPSVVRGLGYYTGPVYEAELTFEITDEKGRPRQFGSVAGGGRYDDLVKRFTGQSVPATGVSIGVDRLLAALREKGRDRTGERGPVVVTVMDRDRMADYQTMVAELRTAGIRAEVYLGNPKNFGNQLKYADRRASPVAVIEGAEEKASGIVQIKDLILGARIAQNATLEEWKERPSQIEVPRAELVSRVLEMLNGQGNTGIMMPSRAQTLTRAAELRARFEAAGAVVVEPPILQPAETLLDLYGENIRARAYVTSDALRGEQMLRPDFTVPVVQMHMALGAEPARYTYAGEVFRRQEHDPDRASEFVQVGYEVFDRSDPTAADAEVFALIRAALEGLNLHAATGDIGILMAAVAGLKTSADRRAALMRHIWRPRRFRALLDRYGGHAPVPPTRIALLAAADPMAAAGPEIGLRGAGEIAARVAALRADAAQPRLAETELQALAALLGVREALPFALERLRDIAVDLPQITPALNRLEARAEALTARGVDVSALDFEASYGRTSMEYYDGFVFGFHAVQRPDLPPIATGGRYDALTRHLGRGTEIPAVGGVLRPGLILQLQEAPR